MIYILKNIGKGKIGLNERQISSNDLFRIDNDPKKDTNIYISDFLFSNGIVTLERTDGATLTQNFDERYIQSFTETDPTVPQHVKSITLNNLSNWNSAFQDNIVSMDLERYNSMLKLSLNQRGGGKISKEVDLGKVIDDITQITNRDYNDLQNLPTLNLSDWNTAFGWGDHSTQGYITGIVNITDIPNRSYNDLQDLPDINALVDVIDTNTNPERHQIATVGGAAISETVTKLNKPSLSGNILSIKLLNEDGVEQKVSIDLSTVMSNSSGISNATYDASTNIITLLEGDGDEWKIDLGEFSIISSTDPYGVTELTQESETKLTVSKVGQTGVFEDLRLKPITLSGYGIQNAYTQNEIGQILRGNTSMAGYNKYIWDSAYNWGDHAQEGYLTEYQNLDWDVSLGDLSIINGNTVNFDGRYAQVSQLKNLAYNGLKITDENGIDQFSATTFLSFEGVRFDAENHKIIIKGTPPQVLEWNGIVSGKLSISGGNTIDLDGRYGRNPYGREGQQYFLSESGTNTITPEFPMKRGIIVETQEEFDVASGNGLSLNDTFNEWTMFSHYYGSDIESQSPPSFPALNETEPEESARLTGEEFYNKSAWGYNEFNERITLSKNYKPYTGLISPKKYSDYTLNTTLSSSNNDNEQIGVVIGFYKDPDNGFEHTLTVIRELIGVSGQANTSYRIVYNLGQNPTNSNYYKVDYNNSSEKTIIDGSQLAPTPQGATGWVGNDTGIEVQRGNDLFSIKTSQFGSTNIDDNTEILLDLDDYPELAKFKGASEIGFSAMSQKDVHFSNIYFSKFTGYIFWNLENSYETWEFNQTAQTYTKQTPNTTKVGDHFGISRFIDSYLFKKTYYVNEYDGIIKVGQDINPYYTYTEMGDIFNGITSMEGYNKVDWDEAFSWGNHADAGYQTIVKSYRYFGALNNTHNIFDLADVKVIAGESGYWRLNIYRTPIYAPNPTGLPEEFIYNEDGEDKIKFLSLKTDLDTYGEITVTDDIGNIWSNNKNNGVWDGWIKNTASNDYSDLENLPENLSDFNDDIGATEPIVPNTIFVDTLDGDDTLGVVQNQARPFKTDSGAYDALPEDDGTTWTIEYIDNVNKTMTASFPYRPLKIKSKRGGTFDFSQVTGNNQANSYLEIDIPKCNFVHRGTVESKFGCSNGVFKLHCRNMYHSTPAIGFSGFYSGDYSDVIEHSYIKCNNLHVETSEQIIGFYGDLVVNNTLFLPNNGNFTGNSCKTITLNILKINKTGLGEYSIMSGNGDYGQLNISEVTGTGTLVFQNNYQRTVTYDLDGLKVGPNIKLQLIKGLNLSAKITVTGILHKDSGMLYVGNGSSTELTFTSFEGKIDALSGGAVKLKTFNSTFYVENEFINSSFSSVEFSGVTTIIQNNVGDLFSNITSTKDIIITGKLNTNAITFGDSINPIFKTKDILPTQVDATQLLTFIDDDEALSGDLQYGYLYIHQDTGLIKRVGTPLSKFVTQEDLEDLIQDKHYVHEQPTLEVKWVIPHNLNKMPSINLTKLDGGSLWGAVTYIDNNNIEVLFNQPYSGYAYIN